VSGCAKAKAASVPDGPPLAVPAAPARVLAPVEELPVAQNEPEPEPAVTPPRATTSPARPTTPRRPATTAATPAEEPKPETPPPAPAATEPPGPRPATQVDAAAERKIRDLLRRAASDLARVDWQRLSPQGKEQYDRSKQFNDQAEKELKDRNYVLAMTIAEKAAGIATELLGAR
jgi:outer membrane biosynthesis protein TonB